MKASCVHMAMAGCRFWLQGMVLAKGLVLAEGLALAEVFNIFYKLLILVISNSFIIYIVFRS
jgi:hypothetical protein